MSVEHESAELGEALRKDKIRAALFDEPMKERRLGRYRVIGTLGRGGMGTVLEAVDDVLGRSVALKLLHREVSERDQRRLLREARALASVSHPNVVQVYEVGEQPRPFIAMELVRGRTLAAWQRERRPWRACVEVYLQAGRGLAAVHDERLIHRDFKPSNCIIDDGGRVRVTDFGLARSLGPGSKSGATDEALAEPMTEQGVRDSSLTETGAVVGTLAYMSLEQLEGREVDDRSDQLAFCIALFEALYGQRPFEGRTASGLAEAMRAQRIALAPQGSSVPRSLRRVLLRGLAAEPEQRWPSMTTLLDALERLIRPRWRSRMGAAVLVTGLGTAGAMVWIEARTDQGCADASSQLQGIWDEARRDRVRGALRASGLPYAEDAWIGVKARLDAYGEAWSTAWGEVCEASSRGENPEPVTTQQAACLHERKVALREAVDVLAGGEPSAVERAVGLVARLPPIDRCTDVSALIAGLPPPEDLEIRAGVRALRDRLARARALRIAGRYAASLEVVEEVAAQGAGLDYAPLLAEIELGRGWAHYGEGHHDEAAAAFEAAYFHGTVEGHDAVVTSAAAMLAYLFGDVRAKHDQGLQWGATAQAHALRPGAEPGAEGTALANIAAVHMRAGDLESARASYEHALASLEDALGPSDVRLAFTLNGLAIASLGLGDTERALATHLRALALRRDNLGPRHPHVAMSLNNLGVVLHRMARFEEAESHFRQALEIKEGILGVDHPDLVSSIINLASIAVIRQDFERAVELNERAIIIAEQAHGPQAPRIPPALQSIAAAREEQGRYEEARQTYLQSLELAERISGPRHADHINTLRGLARVELELGELDAATDHTARALEIADAVLPPNSPDRADTLAIESALLRRRGRPAEALELAERALALREDAGQPLPAVVQSRLTVARALAAIDEPERALRMVQECIDALATSSDPMATRMRADAEALREELRRPDPPR